MDVAFDPAKRDRTLQERGLVFSDAAQVFDGRVVTSRDDRRDYGEDRYITFGMLQGRVVVLVWTPRVGARRVISMRLASGHEAERYHKRVD